MISLKLQRVNVFVMVVVLCCLLLEKLIPNAVFKGIYIPLMLYAFIPFLKEVFDRLISFTATGMLVILSVLVAVALVSSFANEVNIGRTLTVVSYSMKYLVFYYVIKQLDGKGMRQLELLIIVLLLSEAMLGMVQFIFPGLNQIIIMKTLANTTDNFMTRMSMLGVSGTLGSKNVFGLAMNIGIVMAGKRYVENRNVAWLFSIIVFSVAVLISASRFNMLLVTVLGAFFLKKKYGAVPSIMVSCCLLLLVIALFQKGGGNSYVSLTELFTREYWQVSLERSRLLSWLVGYEILKDNPLFGIGAGSWGAGLAYNSSSYFSSYKGFLIITDVLQDNFWISEATQFGFCYLGVLLYLFRSIWRSLENNFYNNYFMLIIVASSFIYPTIIMKVIGFLFWVYIGIDIHSGAGKVPELSRKSSLLLKV